MEEIKQKEEKNESILEQIENKKDILKWVALGFSGFAIVVLIFGAGVFVGGRKAQFSCNWAENYQKNFGGPQQGFMGNWQNPLPPMGGFINGHGNFGEIIQVNESDLVIKGRDDVEKIIVIGSDTIIEKERASIAKEDLKAGDFVVVIGSPNDEGQVQARLIRVFENEEALRHSLNR